MARTFRNLWSRLASWENLREAYRLCRRRKRYRRGAAEFDFAWEANLLALQRELRDGTYRPGPYRHFHIVDPKPRRISAAPFRDRVVHHAVVRVLEPIFERQFIFDSYACRRGKGTHRAIDRAQRYLRRYDYYLKTDIVRFFPNVDHALLLELVARTIRDGRVMNLIRTIIESGRGVLAEEGSVDFFPGDDLWALGRPRGLPIGNLTSQFFANVLLDHIDHFVKEELCVPGYVRYADDLLLFDDDKGRLWEWREALVARLEAIRLRLHADKTQIRPSRRGIEFLGLKIGRDGRRLPQGAIRRFNRRRRQQQHEWSRGQIGSRDLCASLHAWRAFTAGANSSGIWRILASRLRFTRGASRKVLAEGD